MKNLKSLRTYLVLVMALGLSVAMTSCGDDDSTPEIQSAKDVEGNYTGKMSAIPMVAPEMNTASASVDVTAKVEATDVVFDKFPVAELIKLIVPGEEAADAIVKAVGDVTYKLPYTAKLSKDYTTIDLAFVPVPLVLEIAFPPVVAPTEGEAEAPKTKVTVTISAEDAGVFTYEGKTLKFNMNIEKVMLGEGETEAELPMPAKLKLNFDLAR